MGNVVKVKIDYKKLLHEENLLPSECAGVWVLIGYVNVIEFEVTF